MKLEIELTREDLETIGHAFQRLEHEKRKDVNDLTDRFFQGMREAAQWLREQRSP